MPEEDDDDNGIFATRSRTREPRGSRVWMDLHVERATHLALHDESDGEGDVGGLAAAAVGAGAAGGVDGHLLRLRRRLNAARLTLARHGLRGRGGGTHDRLLQRGGHVELLRRGRGGGLLSRVVGCDAVGLLRGQLCEPAKEKGGRVKTLGLSERNCR